MKELDILLERFIVTHETDLAAGEWPEFEALLQTEDDCLWDWLQNPERTDATAYRALLMALRSHHA